MKLTPRIFRYNGLGGTEDNGRLYVGLMAQEVPPALAFYCRVRTRVYLRPSDAAPTEIMMLDHSAFPFLCINALKEHEYRNRRHTHPNQRRPSSASATVCPLRRYLDTTQPLRTT